MSAIEREIDVAARFSENDLPPAGQSEEPYLDYLKSLQGASSSWDRGKGWISWLQGQALNRLIDSIRRKACRRGAYGRVLRQVGLRETTAWYCRQIAAQCMPDEARTLGYLEMLHRIGAMGKADDRPGSEEKVSKRYLQQIEAIRKRLIRMGLQARDVRLTPQGHRLVMAEFAGIARTAKKAMDGLARREKGVLLSVVAQGAAREAV